MMSYNVSVQLVCVSVALVAFFIYASAEVHLPKPYAFGYNIKDKHGVQYREEAGDGVGVVKGSYGFTDERGVHRQVHYIADKAGFRAEIKTNEHGTAPLNPAAVKMISSAHPYFGGAGHVPKLVHAPFTAPAKLAAESAAYGIPAPILPLGLPGAGLAVGEPSGIFSTPLLGGAVKGYDSRFGEY